MRLILWESAGAGVGYPSPMQSLCRARVRNPKTALPSLLPAPTGSLVLNKPEFLVSDGFLVWGLWVVLHHTTDCFLFHSLCKYEHEQCAAWGIRELPSCRSMAGKKIPFFIGKRNYTFCSDGHFPGTSASPAHCQGSSQTTSLLGWIGACDSTVALGITPGVVLQCRLGLCSPQQH